MPGARLDRFAQHVREQIVGTRVAEHAARRLADRRADGGDDVGVLDLFGHSIRVLISVIPAKAGIQLAGSKTGVPAFAGTTSELSSAAACRSSSCARCAPASSAVCASATKCLRSRSSSHFSSTSEPRSIAPPHSVSRDARCDLVVVLRDEAAFEHVDEHHLEARRADVAGDDDVARRQRRALARFGQRCGDLLGDVEQFEGVEHDDVALAQQARAASLRARCRRPSPSRRSRTSS